MKIHDLVAKHFDPRRIIFITKISYNGILMADGAMKIRANQSDQEKVMTILHELLHYDPKYPRPMDFCTPEYDEIENEIEVRAHRIFTRDPDLVIFLKRNLNLPLTFREYQRFTEQRGQLQLF